MYLLRVLLPDVPGSLGRLASAIGSAGGDIDAIEIVERHSDGTAIDDVFVVIDHGVMADSIVSACTSLEGVTVQWISRYGAGSNLIRDLEAVEAMTREPKQAKNTLVDLIPVVFVVDWAMRVSRADPAAPGSGTVLHRSTAAPEQIPDDVRWPGDLSRGGIIAMPERYSDLLVAGAALDHDELVVVGRNGGPRILDSEIARLSHLAALARSISS